MHIFRFILLGSASPELIRDSSESLAGRIVYEELTPFLLNELIGHKDLIQHWLSGGFPDACLAPGSAQRTKWHESFVRTYLERDLPLLGLNLDWANTRKLWNMLAHLHGNVLNMNNLGKSLSFLEHAFLIRQLYPFSVNVKKRLVKSPKIYIRDSGMLHHLLNIQSMDELESHPVLGHSWEGYVIEQIIGNLDTTTDTFFYRTHEGAEIDLVLVKGGEASAAIEIKYTSAPKISRGLTAAIRDVGAKRNFIITPNTDEYYIRDNILVCKLSTFLEKIVNL